MGILLYSWLSDKLPQFTVIVTEEDDPLSIILFTELFFTFTLILELSFLGEIKNFLGVIDTSTPPLAVASHFNMLSMFDPLTSSFALLALLLFDFTT